MGFFSKLFRRNKTKDDVSPSKQKQYQAKTAVSASPRRGGGDSNNNNNNNSRGNSRRGVNNNNNKTSNSSRTSTAADRDSPTEHPADEDGPIVHKHRGNNGNNGNTNGLVNNSRAGAGPDLSQGSMRPVLDPSVLALQQQQQQQQQQGRSVGNMTHGNGNNLVSPRQWSGPVDLDDTDIEEEAPDQHRHYVANNNNNVPIAVLSTQRLEQFDMQPQNQPHTHHSMSMSAHVFTMDSVGPESNPRFSAGLQQMEDTRSDAESSSFNLSTDAEDTEYESLKRRGGMPHHHGGHHHNIIHHNHLNHKLSSHQQLQLDTSALSQVSSPNYMDQTDGETSAFNTDGETSVFPNLATDDDDATERGSVVSAHGLSNIMGNMSGNMSNNNIMSNSMSNQEDVMEMEPGRIQIVSISKSPMSIATNTNTAMNMNTNSNTAPTNNASPAAAGINSSPTAYHRGAALNSTTTTSQMATSNTTPTGNFSATNAFSQSFGSSGFGNHEHLFTTSGVALSSPTSLSSSQSHAQSLQESQSRVESRRNNNFTSPKNTAAAAAVTTTTSQSTAGNTNAISPRMSMSAFGDDFANFADFSNFDNQAWGTEPAAVQPTKVSRRITIETDRGSGLLAAVDQSTAAAAVSRSSATSGYPKSSASAVGHTDNSLSELLAQAKSKSSSSNRRNHNAGGSVNSAPVVTASSYYRHGIRTSRSDRNMAVAPGGSDTRSSHDATSVSDIIQSLDAANATRSKTTSGGSRSQHRSGSDALSVHSRDASASVRSAKERLREKRRREREGRRSSRSPEGESSESDDNEDSWLFDEVTGALGPRGIAADLESLSGRSNRSNTSKGGQSHRSHRSHKSHQPSRRKPKTSSGESVDSHGSRRSRSSRYSHRSSRSYISQMSEQSRSVANDLLRLEMQLAMVGSTGDAAADVVGHRSSSVVSGASVGGGRSGTSVGGGRSGTSVGGGRSGTSVGGGRSGTSVGGGSRTSRTSATHRTSSSNRRSTSSARRSRMTVVAPPGKLGIILANKADSKGTVVSGVRTSSILAEKISPGDRIVAIDGEDVSLMTVSEITTIMARKSDFERTLSVLTTPKHMDTSSMSRSPTHGTSDYDKYRYSRN
jgi:hypothetical protein